MLAGCLPVTVRVVGVARWDKFWGFLPGGLGVFRMLSVSCILPAGERRVRCFAPGFGYTLVLPCGILCSQSRDAKAMIVKELTEQECANILTASSLGHLACVRDNRPYVVPITFAFADNCIYSFSLIGQKIEWMR